jgi:hydroxylamine reductase (hybrid-cluster protein)
MNLNQAHQFSGASTLTATTPAPVSGLHEGLSVTLQRIINANLMLDGALQRIHGPRPSQVAPSQKSPETPSIMVQTSNIGQELDLLERLSSDLCQFIG